MRSTLAERGRSATRGTGKVREHLDRTFLEAILNGKDKVPLEILVRFLGVVQTVERTCGTSVTLCQWSIIFTLKSLVVPKRLLCNSRHSLANRNYIYEGYIDVTLNGCTLIRLFHFC